MSTPSAETYARRFRYPTTVLPPRSCDTARWISEAWISAGCCGFKLVCSGKLELAKASDEWQQTGLCSLDDAWPGKCDMVSSCSGGFVWVLSAGKPSLGRGRNLALDSPLKLSSCVKWTTNVKLHRWQPEPYGIDRTQSRAEAAAFTTKRAESVDELHWIEPSESIVSPSHDQLSSSSDKYPTPERPSLRPSRNYGFCEALYFPHPAYSR